MISLADIHETTATLPPRVLVHGQEGVGKTTLASKFPEPVFLQTEDGTPGGLKLASFGLLSSLGDVRDALTALGSASRKKGISGTSLSSKRQRYHKPLVGGHVQAEESRPPVEGLGACIRCAQRSAITEPFM